MTLMLMEPAPPLHVKECPAAGPRPVKPYPLCICGYLRMMAKRLEQERVDAGSDDYVQGYNDALNAAERAIESQRVTNEDHLTRVHNEALKGAEKAVKQVRDAVNEDAALLDIPA